MRRRFQSVALLASVLIGIGTAAAVPAFGDETTVGGYANPADPSDQTHQNLRQNWDDNEQDLTSDSVTQPDFGKLWSASLDGTTSKTPNQVYAQPLVYNGYVYVATEDNQIEKLDERTGAKVASRNLGPAWTPIQCGDLTPHVGVTSTPVIDPSTKTMYVITKTQVPGKTSAFLKMWGLSTDTLSTRPGWPLDIQGVPSNSNIALNQTTANPRPGLMVDGKHAVYFATASHCDHGPYVGYVGRVSTSNGNPGSLSLWSAESKNALDEAGIWQTGGGVMSDGNDSNGNPRIFVATGNGVAPAKGPGNKPPGTLGESVVRLDVDKNGTMDADDYFSPTNSAQLNGDDDDLGSGAPVALPDSFGTTSHPHLTTVAGKDGSIYLLDRDNLGGTGQGPKDSDAAVAETQAGGGVWGHAGVFDGGTPTTRLVYYAPSHQPMKAYLIGKSSGDASATPTMTQVGTTAESFNYGVSSPVVTSYHGDASSALVWVTLATGGNSGTGGYLEAYPAVPPLNSPWKPVVKYAIGTQNKFTNIATSGGRVFVGTKDGHVLAFGRPTTGAVTAPPTDFGQQPVNSTATTHTVTLTATRTVTVKSVTVNGAAFARGDGQPSLPQTLSPGQTLAVPVAFRPTAAGINNGTLTVDTTPTDTGADTKYPFSLSGIGTQDGILANPTSIDFKTDAVSNGVNQSLTIQNTGTTSAQITKVSMPASSAFRFYGAQPKVGDAISPQGVATFTVEFLPRAAVRYTGSVTVSVIANGKTYTVTMNLKGQGINGAPKLVFSGYYYSGGALNFGTVAPGVTDSAYLTITNQGNVADKINKAATPSEPFEVPNPIDEGVTIQPGDSLSVQIVVNPTTGNPRQDHYIISDANGAHYVYMRVNYYHQVGPVRGPFGCITDRDLIRVDGNPIVNTACNGTASQDLGYSSDDRLHWFAAYGDRCITPRNNAKSPSTPVLYEKCSTNKSQVWVFTPSGKLLNPNSGLCLAVRNSSTAPNTPLILASCASRSKGELWDPNSVIGRRGWVWSGLGSLGQFCLTGPKYGATNKQPMNVQTCNLQKYNGQYTAAGNANPSQVIAHLGSTLRVSGGCLTQSHYAKGSAVLVEPCVNSVSQRWAPQANGSVRNTTTRACLNVYGGKPTATASRRLTTYTCNGTAAQAFALPDK